MISFTTDREAYAAGTNLLHWLTAMLLKLRAGLRPLHSLPRPIDQARAIGFPSFSLLLFHSGYGFRFGFGCSGSIHFLLPPLLSQSQSLLSNLNHGHRRRPHHHHHRLPYLFFSGNNSPAAMNGDASSYTKKKPKLSPPDIASEFSHHDPTVARINNGSFGCCPRSVTAAQHDWQHQFLRQPDDFFLNHLQPAISRSRSLVASLVNAPHVDQISLVDNATTAAAIFLQHCSWSFAEGRFNPGDAAVMLHYAYGAVKKSVEAYITRAGGHVIEVDLPFPVKSDDEIITEFRKSIAKGKRQGRKVRIAVIDHVTSMPTVVIPVKELVKICREEGVEQVFVDAAHGIGCVDVDVQDIGADFYTSNLHKWFFCPPSVAFLYCRNQSTGGDTQLQLHHPVVSHEYGNGLPVESGWIGTRDYSAQLVVPSAVEFVARFPGGIEGIKAANHSAVVEMGEMLAKAWGTNLGCPVEMCGTMIMVGLPACLGIRSESDSLKLRTHLRDCFKVEVPIHFNKHPRTGEGEEGAMEGVITGYARISYQVYNKVEDYERLRDAVQELVSDGFTYASLVDQSPE